MALTSWSIQREDILLLRALQDIDRDAGFYIDVGANNPQEESDTKLFYDHGWHGINVEPSPYWYNRLVSERPRDINIQAAASDRPGLMTLFDHPEGGLGTLREDFADRHAAEYHIDKRPIEVEARTLAEICKEHAAQEIHFLKVDVEGHEENVFRGMDFTQFRPWIVLAEATEPLRLHMPTYEAWEHLITDSGYCYMLFDGLNRWYVAEEHPERFPAFRFPVDDYIHWSHLRRISNLEIRVRHLESVIQESKGALNKA